MCLVKIVFAVFVWTTVTNYVFVSGEDNDEVTTETPSPEEKTEPPPVENHTFVALIEIVFVDGHKRQCTGTIIHDNVVVTAAHCFLHDGPKNAEIEMTGSFVVIGTKKMFDTGYENYLPIERIITHPRYKGWTADLALVFTFAGMTTDKPGYALPLIGEGASTPVDSNVTILSWGRCADDGENKQTEAGEKKRTCASSEEENESCERPHRPLRAGTHNSEHEHSSQHRSLQVEKTDSSPVDLTRITTAHNSHRVLNIINKQKLSQDYSPGKPKQSNEPHQLHKLKQLNVTFGPDNHTISMESSRVVIAKAQNKGNFKALRRHRKRANQKASRNMPIVHVKNIAIHHKNWRRQDEPKVTKENSLTVETFGFVNVQTCKKLVDKVMPKNGINTNEVVCYAADEHYISDDDSGAPAVRQGHLVAVTVGGVECDGDHVAIGIKMNCFCSWIADNLPEINDWKCCDGCCTGDEPTKSQKLRKRHPYD